MASSSLLLTHSSILQLVEQRERATHGFDQNQRAMVVTHVSSSPESETIGVDAPDNPNAAPPGYYLLFVVTFEGVPSKGKFVRLS